MSETKETKERGPVSRYYIDNGTIVRRLKGAEDERNDLSTISADVRAKLEAEGYIWLRSHGVSHEEIISGADNVFPNRTLPVSVATNHNQPGQWVKAIAAVRTKDTVKAKRSAGVKPTPSEIWDIEAASLVWAKSLTREQVATLRTNKFVRLAHAELTGDATSLDEMLASRATAPAASEMEQAAD